MTTYQLWISFYTMLRKDMVRIFRIWVQTFLPSVITSCLYFLIFGSILGSRIGDMQGVAYMTFVVPGLVMLAIVTNAYSNTSFSFFQSKFFARSIDEILVSPTPPWLLIAGFIAGGVVRGILVGALVLLVSVFFTGLHLSIANLGIILLFAILTALVFSLAGLVNGVYAKSIDAINIIPTFVLTPLTYLGGVFYSVHSTAAGRAVRDLYQSHLLPGERLPLRVPRHRGHPPLDLARRLGRHDHRAHRHQLVPHQDRPGAQTVSDRRV